MHKVGNNYADLLAKEACKIFDVVDSLAAPVIRRINDLKLIQKRLASIVCHLPNRPKVPRVPPVPRPRVSLEDLFHTSSHIFLPADFPLSHFIQRGRLTCASCRSSCSIKSNRLKEFLTGPCDPLRVQEAAPFHRILGGTISLNGIQSHPSHVLQIVNKHFVCMACGKKNAQRLYHLKEVCKPRRLTAYGTAVLKAAAEGTL